MTDMETSLNGIRSMDTYQPLDIVAGPPLTRRRYAS